MSIAAQQMILKNSCPRNLVESSYLLGDLLCVFLLEIGMLWFGKLDLYEIWEPKKGLAEIIWLQSPYVNSPSPTAPWSTSCLHHEQYTFPHRNYSQSKTQRCINIIHLSLFFMCMSMYTALDSTEHICHIEFTV